MTTILHKRNSIIGKIPNVSELEVGELAINTTDGKLYTKKDVFGVLSIVEIGGYIYDLPSELEKVEEAGNIGWRILGRDSTLYGDIGQDAIDFSMSLSGSTNGATGPWAFASGLESKAQGDNSYAEGRDTLASGYISHAEGQNTLAIGSVSHAEGYKTSSQGDYGTHAEGNSTVAVGNSSHAEGYETLASGSSSHAEGNSTIAIGDNSHAEGEGTQAAGENSHSAGQYNLGLLDTIHETGIGIDDVTRANAFEIYKDGRLIAPSQTLALITDNKSLATKEYVDSELSELNGYVPSMDVLTINIGAPEFSDLNSAFKYIMDRPVSREGGGTIGAGAIRYDVRLQSGDNFMFTNEPDSNYTYSALENINVQVKIIGDADGTSVVKNYDAVSNGGTLADFGGDVLFINCNNVHLIDADYYVHTQIVNSTVEIIADNKEDFKFLGLQIGKRSHLNLNRINAANFTLETPSFYLYENAQVTNHTSDITIDHISFNDYGITSTQFDIRDGSSIVSRHNNDVFTSNGVNMKVENGSKFVWGGTTDIVHGGTFTINEIRGDSSYISVHGEPLLPAPMVSGADLDLVEMPNTDTAKIVAGTPKTLVTKEYVDFKVGNDLGVLKFTDLSDTPGSMGPATIGKWLQVDSTGTTLEYVDSIVGAQVIDDLNDVNIPGIISDGDHLRYDNDTHMWTNYAHETVASTDITDFNLVNLNNGDTLEYQNGFWINTSEVNGGTF